MISMDWEEALKGNYNVNYCTVCREAGRKHEITDIPIKERTDYGAPMHKRHCTGCGCEDGPWIYAKDHWSGGFV